MSSILVAGLVYLFLVFFQPFGTYNYAHAGKYLLLIPYAIIAFVTFFIGDYFISRIFSKWTWINEISKNCILLFFCSILNYCYSVHFINDADFNALSLFYMVMFTYTLGIPICSIAVLGKYSFLKNNKIQLAIPATTEANANIKEAIESISIIPDVGEKMNLSKNSFLYAQSEGNYSDIFYLNNEKVEKKLLRISLKNLEGQICKNEIIRCHRSYILNIQNAINKRGNAQGFKISLKHTSEKVPVSRKYIGLIRNISF